MSDKWKTEAIRARREARSKYKSRDSLAAGLRDGTVVHVNKAKVFSRSMLPNIPDYYYDIDFQCRDCEATERWTAKKQKVYYEEQKGEIEGLPIRCNKCRKRHRERKAEARLKHLAGIERKNSSRLEDDDRLR